ncbi:DUF2911 domain-containing protein [Rhodoflexus caldus]|uniref:DUF2911 domain-containing protein n=1 Tax=Rhodoflexus caldus TaxID=2891236 RepID=UPI002029C5D9|nr:DUF2911 domain-containing protein [Rhodoflexus caldus]
MKNLRMKHFVFTLMAIATVVTAKAQLNTPQPSPAAKISQAVGLGEITVSYSRPSMKGRVIFGDLVPYGALWRTGANAATKFTFSEDVTIGGKTVPKGDYSLFTIPNQNSWVIIFNKNATAQTNNYKQEEDVVRFEVKPESLPTPVESFTINFADVKPNSAVVEIMWEKTAVRFRIETEVDSKVMAQIQRALDPKKDAGLYYQIASYLYDNNKDQVLAYDLITKSVDMQPQYWTVHLKAKIEYKLGKFKEAIATAERSMAMAKEAGNNDYVRLNEKLIAEAKKGK